MVDVERGRRNQGTGTLHVACGTQLTSSQLSAVGNMPPANRDKDGGEDGGAIIGNLADTDGHQRYLAADDGR